MWTVRTSLVAAAFLLGAAATLVCPDASRAAPDSQDALHEVQPGDNLHLIAGYYYGDARQWNRIWQANRDQISNPNRIEPRTLLRIPDAVVPEEPYADFVARAHPWMAPPEAAPKAEAPRGPEVRAQTPGEAPPAPASSGMQAINESAARIKVAADCSGDCVTESQVCIDACATSEKDPSGASQCMSSCLKRQEECTSGCQRR